MKCFIIAFLYFHRYQWDGETEEDVWELKRESEAHTKYVLKALRSCARKPYRPQND